MAAPVVNTSFQKKIRAKVLQIRGTKPSLQNNQLLISTGVPSLDNVLGGGIAVGTTLLVEEDTYGSYGKLLLKYFVAEGVTSGHELFLASADSEPESILKELPAVINNEPGGGDTVAGQDESMKIAWRYQNLPQLQSQPVSTRFGNYYDLTKTMNDEAITCVSKQLFYLPDECQGRCVNSEAYSHLFGAIQDCVEKRGFSTNQTVPQKNILRIAVQSLGSPLWGEHGGLTVRDIIDHSLPQFLYALRCLLRSSYATCIITLPSHLFHDVSFVKKCEALCDTVVGLESFVGSDKETNPVYKDYHGLFKLRKLPRLNSLTCHMPESWDLAFKLRRKKFTIEKLHLPPELSETVSRTQEDSVLPKSGEMSCASGSRTNKLDF